MQNESKTINIIFALLFGLIISVPWLCAHRSAEARVSSAENRTLAAYPSFADETGAFNRDILTDYEEWLSDNLRGRQFIVSFYSRLQYTVFGRVVKSDTLEGKDHWLYTKSPEMENCYSHTDLLSEEELDLCADLIEDTAAGLKSEGIGFIYFPCYDKVSIYPEYYEEGAAVCGDISRSEQFVSALKDRKSITVADPRQTLLDNKALYRDPDLYYKLIDTNHWNAYGAHLGYEVLMQAAAGEIPDEDIRILAMSDYEVTSYEGYTDIYGFRYPYTETVPSYTLISPRAHQITEPYPGSETQIKTSSYTLAYENPDADNDLRVLIFNDSFIRMFLVSDIAESFRYTLSLDMTNLDNIDAIVKAYSPDLVILENTEFTFPQMISLLSDAEDLK